MKKHEPIKQHVKERHGYVPLKYPSHRRSISHLISQSRAELLTESLRNQPYTIGVLPEPRVEQLLNFYSIQIDGAQYDELAGAVVVATSPEEAISLIDREDYKSGITATLILPTEPKIILNYYVV